jgi:DNA-binding response OmpR family regulator
MVSGRPILVLLVSSDPAVLQTVERTLRAQRTPLVCAASIERARAILRQASPDLLIADLEDSFETLRPNLAPTTAVLGLCESSHPATGSRPRFTLTKPFDADVLMAAIHRLRGGD